MKFEILISTYGAEGISRLGRPGALPEIGDVSYLISWQRGPAGKHADASSLTEIPQSLIRKDVRIVISGTTGSGANRKNCIDHAKGDWCMIADDDLEFNPKGIRCLISELEKSADVDFAIAQSSGADNKWFPAEGYDVFPLKRKHFVTEFEVVVRLDAILKAGVNYNPNFGVGIPEYQSGEGAVFFYELRRKGLKGRYFPINIVNHPGLTTTERSALQPGVLKAEGVAIALEYPFTGVLRAPLVVWRRSRRFHGSFFRALPPVFKGFVAGIFRRKSLGIGQ